MSVPCGDAFLPDVKLSTLREMLRKEPVGKSRDMLVAAVKRKASLRQKDIGKCLERGQTTIGGWLHRLKDGGLEGRFDHKSPGRPCNLSEEQQKEICEDLSKEPHECGFERGTWTSSLLSQHIGRKFGVKYTPGGALKLAHRLGFSENRGPSITRLPRPK